MNVGQPADVESALLIISGQPERGNRPMAKPHRAHPPYRQLNQSPRETIPRVRPNEQNSQARKQAHD